jgi:hypothetical protein
MVNVAPNVASWDNRAQDGANIYPDDTPSLASLAGSWTSRALCNRCRSTLGRFPWTVGGSFVILSPMMSSVWGDDHAAFDLVRTCA